MGTKSKTRILVVEDDVTVRQTISKLLVAEGYNVSTANDGFDALLHLQQAIPDLILSDFNIGIRVAVRRTAQIPKKSWLSRPAAHTIPVLYPAEL